MKKLVLAALLALGSLAFASELTADAASPRWVGTCYLASGCIGLSEGTMSDSQCQAMGGHSMDIGAGSCINF